MENLKAKVSNIFRAYLEIFPRYAVTMVWILLTALVWSIFLEAESPFGQFMCGQGVCFGFLCGIGSYLAETWFFGNRSVKWAGIAAAVLIAVGLTAAAFSAAELTKFHAVHGIIAYAIAALMLGVWKNCRNSGQAFNAYCLRAVHRLFRMAVFSMIIAVALALVLLVLNSLLLNGSDPLLYARAEILAVGCLAGFGILIAQLPSEEDVSGFFAWVVRVLLGMVMIAFVIVYIYILKIIITRVVPSNEIFRILAGLFVLGLPVWTLAGALPQSRFIHFGKLLPFVFIPFLTLQGYAVGTRIAAFGITPLRYLGLVLMLFEVLYILLYALRKGEVGQALLIIAGLAVVCLVVPFVNMYSVSDRSQKAILDEFDGDYTALSVEERSRLAGAYHYLENSTSVKDLLPSVDEALSADISSSGLIGDLEYDSSLMIYEDFPSQSIDISAFSMLTFIETDPWVAGISDTPEPDWGAVAFLDDFGEVVLTADIQDYVDECIRVRKNGTADSPLPDQISLEDGSVIRLSELHLVLSPDGDLQRFYLAGYYLS